MMDLSLAGLIGAVIGTIVAALAYVPLLTFVERGLRSRVSAGSADERQSFEQEASLLRRAVLAVDINRLCGHRLLARRDDGLLMDMRWRNPAFERIAP